MKEQFSLTEYILSSHSSLDDEHNFGPEICTRDTYAYVILPEVYYYPYTPHPRPGDFWMERVVSAVAYDRSGINILTIANDYTQDGDVYVFCNSIRHHRIGVIRDGQDILETLPRHSHGGQTWGYNGSGPSRTCEIVWGDISGKYGLKEKYPEELGELFCVEGILPQKECFAIPAEVIKRFVEQ